MGIYIGWVGGGEGDERERGERKGREKVERDRQEG